MRPDIATIRHRVAAEAHRLGLPVQVMHVTRRPAGRADRWASPPTPRAAVAYLTTTDPGEAADPCDHITTRRPDMTDAAHHAETRRNVPGQLNLLHDGMTS